MSHKLSAVLLGATILMQQSCAGVVAVGAGYAATTVADRRPLNDQFDDRSTKLNVEEALNALPSSSESKLQVYVLNGEVLLLGQTPLAQNRLHAIDAAKGVEGVVKVVDEIRLMPPLSLEANRKDSWISTKVNTKLLAEKAIPPGRIKVVTENSEVFLIGLVTTSEAERAATVASHIEGVNKVIRMFQLVDGN
jgi:osmotically-inducible protein OsmY